MSQDLKHSIAALAEELDEKDISKSLSVLSAKYPGRITFSSSFSFEDQVIAHVILSGALPISIFTLDTGRMFPETYSVWSRTNEQYQTNIKAYFPQHDAVEAYVNTKGPNAFYESLDNRKECCYIRKVEPLKRALKGNSVWVTGLRAEHSPSRHDMQMVEWDEGNEVIKYHPLLHWNTEEVRTFINKNGIPYNALHDKGFVSIGCAPCTRAILPGEDFRAGRWWWEESTKKECGLHIRPETENKAS